MVDWLIQRQVLIGALTILALLVVISAQLNTAFHRRKEIRCWKAALDDLRVLNVQLYEKCSTLEQRIAGDVLHRQDQRRRTQGAMGRPPVGSVIRGANLIAGSIEAERAIRKMRMVAESAGHMSPEEPRSRYDRLMEDDDVRTT